MSELPLKAPNSSQKALFKNVPTHYGHTVFILNFYNFLKGTLQDISTQRMKIVLLVMKHLKIYPLICILVAKNMQHYICTLPDFSLISWTVLDYHLSKNRFKVYLFKEWWREKVTGEKNKPDIFVEI